MLHAIEKIDPKLVSKNDQRLITKFFINMTQFDMKNLSTNIFKDEFELDNKFADQFFIILKN